MNKNKASTRGRGRGRGRGGLLSAQEALTPSPSSMSFTVAAGGGAGGWDGGKSMKTMTVATDQSQSTNANKRRLDNTCNSNSNANASTSSASKAKVDPKSTSIYSSQHISDTESEETDISGSDGDDTSWISWFCGLKGNEFFCEVDEEYIHDDFNLCGLSTQVPYYDYALDMILDNDPLSGDIASEQHNEMVESAAEFLYGLIHFRYILTSKGLNAMLEKYKRVDFGRCPRVCCGGQPCLPASQTDIPRQGTVKIYCPKCEDLYFPRSKYQSNIDGAFFGTTFSHLFLMTYPSLKPAKPVQTYVPRVYGFKLHKSTR